MKLRVLTVVCFLLVWSSVNAQFANGYQYRKAITIQDAQVSGSGTHTNFPILISHTDSDLSSGTGHVLNSSGYDLLFTDENGTPLDFEIESFTHSSGALRAWVEVTTLNAASNTVIYLYYGKSGATNPSTSATWSADYVLVSHMETSADASTYGQTVSTDNTTSVAGQIGNGRNFNGSNQTIAYADNSSLDITGDITISAWVYCTNLNQPDLITKGGYQSAYGTWLDSDGSLVFQTDANALNGPGGGVTTNTWYYVTFVKNSSGRFLYSNGTLSTSDATATNFTTNNDPLNLSTTDYDYSGRMDEVRIQNTARSADWILTEYNNQNNPSTFYTLGTEECGGPTYYTYQSGNWNTASTWTQDPSGTTLTGSAVPGPCSAVVILSGRTVTANVNNISITGLTIGSGASLLLGSTTGHSFGTVTGTGTMTLNTLNFPSGTFTDFCGSSGGTVNFINCPSGNLPTGQTEFNILNFTNTGATNLTYTTASDLTVHGNLTMSRSGAGTLQWTIGNNTTARTLVLEKSLVVGSGTSIRAGNANAVHGLSLGKSLRNQGDILLTNTGQYVTANNGAVNLSFTGTQNDSLVGSGSNCTLYRLICNKGTDQTYELYVNASNLALYAPVNLANGSTSSPYSEENPEINKALWIRNGTVRLGSNINLPALTEGGNDFFIPLNGCLWVDGATVASTSTSGGSGNTGTTVIGKFRITSGTYNGNKSAGFVYRGTAEIVVEGGTVNIAQFRPSNTVVGPSNNSSYSQSGGTFLVRGDNGAAGELNTGYGIFDLNLNTSTFNMTGGVLRITDATGTGDDNGFRLGMDAPNYNFSGGVLWADVQGGQTLAIRVPAAIYRLRQTNYNASGTATYYPVSGPLEITDSLSIGSNCTFQTNNLNLEVIGHLVVNGTYTPGTNTTVFEGSAQSTFEVNGTISGNLQNLEINKTNATDSLTLEGSAGSLVLNGNLLLTQGVLNSGTINLGIGGNFTTSGTQRGSGYLEFITASTHTWDGSGSGQVQNLRMNGPAATSVTVTLGANQRINGTLTFVAGNTSINRYLDAGAYNLLLGSAANISGATNVSRNMYIRTAGAASNGGISKVLSSTSFTFPVGTTSGYTPATLTLSQAPTVYGTVTVRPVDAAHPNVTQAGVSLNYYWKVSQTGFTLGSATTTWEMTYLQADVTAQEAEYVPGRFSGVSWSSGVIADVNTSTNVVTFSGGTFNTFLTGDYTAGDMTGSAPFGAVPVYYSYNGGGAWSTLGTWSLTDHNTNDPPGTEPAANSVVVIEAGDSVYVSGNGEVCGQLELNGTLDTRTNNAHNFGIITGQGRLRINRSNYFPSGDYSDFLSASGGTVVYYSNNVNILLPAAFTEVNNLVAVLGTTGGYVRSSPNITLTIHGDLTVTAASGTRDLDLDRATWTVEGNAYINADIEVMGNSGISNFTVNGDMIIDGLGEYTINNSGTVTHTLTVGGSLTANGTLDLYRNDTRRSTLTFTGSGVATFSGSATVDLYDFTVDKGTSAASRLNFAPSGTLSLQASEWLTLLNGDFRYQRADTRTVTDNAAGFTIGSTQAISVDNASANLTLISNASSAADLFLSGSLSVLSGTLNIGTPGNVTDNDIEYAATGTPTITLSGGSLNVNGSVRRGTLTVAGALNLSLSGSAQLNISGENAAAARAKLEVLNTGSQLSMSGTSQITLVRGGGTTFGDLYLRPQTASISGGTILIAPVNGAGSGEENFTLDLEPAMNNLTITGFDGDDQALVTLSVNPLTLNGNLTLSNANSSLNTSGLALTLKGNLAQGGSWTASGTTLTLNGTAQAFSGNLTTSNALGALVLNSGCTLTLNADAAVNGDLTTAGGSQLNDNGNSLFVGGHVTLNGGHTSPSNSGTEGLVLNGASSQNLTAAATGNLIINSSGVVLQNNLQINNQLTLTGGVLGIQDKTLTIAQGGTIGGSFGSGAMIQTNGVLSDGGVVYGLPSGTADITFPLGTGGLYTPARYQIGANGSAGTIKVVPVAVKHPATTDPTDLELQYYWSVVSTGFSGLQVTHTYTYDESDVTGDETQWVGARFLSGNWTPNGGIANSIDDVNDSITLANVNYLNGEYTAGQAAEFGTPLTYYSRSGSGQYNWDSNTAWSTDSILKHAGVAADEAPSGAAKIVIAAGDSIYIGANNKVVQSVTVNGSLNLGSTFGHSFGTIAGTGSLRMDVTASNAYIRPAGLYSSFVADTGGTIHYTGTVAATLLSPFTIYRHLKCSGSSAKVLPNQALSVTGNFTLAGGSLSNPNDQDLTIGGDIYISPAATWDVGDSYLLLNGSGQTYSGGPASVNTLEINQTGSSEVVSVEGELTVTGAFTQTQGILHLAGPGELEIQNSWTNTGGLRADSTASLSITGTGIISQSLAFETGYQRLNNLTLNRAGTLPLGSNLSIHGLLQLDNGTFSIGSNSLSLYTSPAGPGALFGGNSSVLRLLGSGGSLNIPSTLADLGVLQVNRGNGATLNGALNVADSLDLSNGALNLNSQTLTLAGDSWIQRSGGSLSAAPAFGGQTNLRYSGTSSITTGPELPGGTQLDTLIIGTTAGVTLTSTARVQDQLNLSSGNLSLGSEDLHISGTIDGSAYLRSSGSGNLYLEGSGNLEIPMDPSANQLDALHINRSGTHLTSANLEVATELNLSSGLLDLQAQHLLLGPSCSVTGSPSASTMVVSSSSGTLRKNFTATGTFTFPVGDNSGTAEYSPATVEMLGGSFNANAYVAVMPANTASGNCPSATDYLSRRWTFTGSNITSFSGRFTGTYTDADINGTEANILAKRYTGSYCANGDSAETSGNTISIYFTDWGEISGGEKTYASEPTTNATAFSVSGKTVSTFDLGWTSGNGQQRLVLARQGGAVSQTPTDGLFYTASASFGGGDDLGSGNYVVYKGSGNSFTVSGLDQNRTYHFLVVEFNKQDTLSENYRVPGTSGSDNTPVRVELDAFIGGTWNGTSMNTTLNSLGLLPLAQPYTGAPYSYAGGESVGSIPSASVVDWALLELRSAATPSGATPATLVGRQAVFLLADGSLVAADGTSEPVIETSASGPLYAVVYHRNHLPAMTADSLSLSGDSYNASLTSSQSAAYNNGTLLLSAGNYGLIPASAENVQSIFLIDGFDRNWVWDERNKTGYYQADVNLDGLVDAADRAETWNQNNQSSEVPQ